MAEPDFTVAQANDLARYFLGPDWTASFLSLSAAPCLLRKETKPLGVVCQGESWREVFRFAGVRLPLRSQYVALGVRVMLADRAICTAVSNTLAKRIAAALNNHIPDRRGI
jgi:hypothetical protein